MKQDMTPYGNIVRRLIEREDSMKSLNVLKAEIILRKHKITQEDNAHEYYMGRKPYSKYFDDKHDADEKMIAEITLIIETLEEEIEDLKKGRKEHEEIAIIGSNRQ